MKGNGFKSMYMMSGNASSQLLEKHKKDTAKVLKSLGRNTAYFGNNFDYSNVEYYKDNENVLFLGALFLRLSKICEMNSFQVSMGRRFLLLKLCFTTFFKYYRCGTTLTNV